MDTRADCSIESMLSLWTKVLRWSTVMEMKEMKNQNPRVAEKCREPVFYIRGTESQTEEHNSGRRIEWQSQALYLL